MTSHPVVLFSCVAENGPVWFSKVQNLILSVRNFGGSLSDAHFITNFVDDVQPEFRSALERLDADVRVVPRHRFFGRMPPTNKLRMFELASTERFDVLLALDCDLIVQGDLAGELSLESLRLVPDTVNCYSDSEWQRLYEVLDVPPPVERYRATGSGAEGFPYFNSGVLFVPRQFCAPLVDHWTNQIERFTDLAVSQPALVPVRDQSDQPPLALALQSSEIPVTLLPLNLNLSTKRSEFAAEYSDQWGPPFIFHYHDQITPAGFIKVSPDRRICPSLDRFNRVRSDALGIPYPGLGRLPWRRRIDNSFLRDLSLYGAVRRQYLKVRSRGQPPRRTTTRATSEKR